MLWILVVVLVLVGAGAAYRVFRPDNALPAATPPVKVRTQHTLLLQIPAANGDAIASALLVTDRATSQASIVLIPSRFVTQIPGYGSAVFGEALRFGGPLLSKETLANQIEIIVDDALLLSPEALAALVDSVGGVTVDVDVDLPGGDESSKITLPAGQDQHLAGPQAAAFAMYGVDGQPELGRLSRVQAVLTGVLDQLVANGVEIDSVIPTSAATPTATVTESLRLLAKAREAQTLSYQVIPVSDIDVGDDSETTRIDTAQLTPMIAAELAGSVPLNEFRPDNRVIVFNGVGTAGIGQSVTRKLNAVGFRVVKTSNAEAFDVKTTQVLIFDNSDRTVRLGEAVARALGLAEDAVEVSDITQDAAEVLIYVGADYVADGSAATVSPGVGS